MHSKQSDDGPERSDSAGSRGAAAGSRCGPSAQRRRNRRLAGAAAALLYLALACALGEKRAQPPADLPPQQWWAERGPVVPHDSFPSDCGLCHEGDSWHSIRADFAFDHEAETGTALLGAHARAECLRCHNDRGPARDFARRGCAGCHEDVHRGRLGRDCSVCHGPEDWSVDESIALHQRTRFPLVGAHAAAACFACHPGAEVGNFDRPPIECVSCHSDELARATSPDHLASGFVDRCDRCHIPTSWGGAGFNHGFFPLVGAHGALVCDACHAGGDFQNTPNTCVGCHLADYQGTNDPNHQAAGFPTSCEVCHDTTSWGAGFTHAFFPLTGAHAPLDCSSCHQGNVFTGTPSTCVGCHLADYQGTNDPNHQAAGFPTSCESCHTTSNWDASFTHAFFPLTGAHAPLDCTQCHAGGVFRGTPSTCVGCHLADYQGTNDPNHQAAGFPTSCEDCHSPTNWDDADFQHDFPLNGPHNEACTECHQVAGNYRLFSCTHCHAHRQSEMDGEHHGVRGYVWSSPACYSCHPNGHD